MKFHCMKFHVRISWHVYSQRLPLSLFVAGWRFRMDGGTFSLCVWVLGAVRVYYWGIREGSTFIAQGRVFAR